jgi:hypothetical protein
LASATFGMAHLKAAPMRRAGATWARAAGEWIGRHLVLVSRKHDPTVLCRSLQIWSHGRIVKYFTICGGFIYSRGRSSLSAPAQIRASGLPAYGSASRARRRGALGGRVETDN